MTILAPVGDSANKEGPVADSKRIVGALNVPGDQAELLQPSATMYYYNPFYRYVKTQQKHYKNYHKRPLHPLSNYANDYDRFPTVA